MDDELAGLRPGRGQAEPEDDVVEAQLEVAKQVVASPPRLAAGAGNSRANCRSRRP